MQQVTGKVYWPVPPKREQQRKSSHVRSLVLDDANFLQRFDQYGCRCTVQITHVMLAGCMAAVYACIGACQYQKWPHLNVTSAECRCVLRRGLLVVF
jgi:hypothetical protein